ARGARRQASAVHAVRDPPPDGRGGRSSGTVRHLADRPARRGAGGGDHRARPARHLPALLRPHVHEPEGFPLRGRDGDFSARSRANLRRISTRVDRKRSPRRHRLRARVRIAHHGRVRSDRRARGARVDLRPRLPRARDPFGPRAPGLRPAGGRLGRFVWALVPAMGLAYAVMALVWPWSVAEPLNPLRAVEYFSRFFEKPWQELFDGRVISVPEMPRSYVPTLFALKLPVILSVLGFGGAAGALVAAFRGSVAANRGAVLLLVALTAILPLAVTIALRPAMYNGIRHFVFVLTPLAVLGGLAAVFLVEIAARRLRFAPVAAA